MRAYSFSIHVDRSPAAVWAFLTDLTQTPKWRTMFKSMSVEGGGPLHAGAKLVVVVEAYGKVAERTIDTTVFEPPRRWVTTSASGNVSGEFEYALTPENRGTRVTASCDLKASRFLAWAFLPIIARQQRRLRTDQLDVFKRACEAATMR